MKNLSNVDQLQPSDFPMQSTKVKRNALWMNKMEQLMILLLVFLWFYTGFDKALNYAAYWKAMHYQVISRDLLVFLVPALPVVEIAIGAMLIIPKFKGLGLWCSTVLMMAFSIYAGLVYFGYFPLRPCACAGLFSKLSWGAHLWVNIFLTLVALSGLIIYRIRRKEGRHN